MTSKNELSLNNEINKINPEDAIDFKEIFFTLYRNRKLIGISALSGLALSTLIAFNAKRVWQGEFQIVLESNTPQNSLRLNPGIARLANLSSQSNSLQTEVGILRSPLVLMNIFDFVKTKKILGGKKIDKLRFSDWQNNLNINLQRDTSILNLSYRDTDKELILPVLNRISIAYQEYSEKKRLRAIELGINFYKEQIKIFNVKSIESLREAQEFAIAQDLSFLDKALIDKEIVNSINIEKIRVESADRIRQIDQQLKRINELEEDPDQIMYVASTISPLKELSNKLKDIDSELAKLKLTYKNQDKSIKVLEREKSFLINLLKRQVKGFLIASKEDALSKLKAAERPEGVLIKYRQLLNKASKDKSTLDNLENQYRALQLEKARSVDPWELITTPTLLPNAVAPNRKTIIMFGLLAGSIAGSTFALINERRKGVIFSISEMQLLMKCPTLANLSFNKKESWEEDLEIIVSGPLSETDGSIALIAVGEIETSTLKYLSQLLKKCLKNREYVFTNKIKEATQYKNLVIVTELGITRKEAFIETQEKILLVKQKLLGSVILNGLS